MQNKKKKKGGKKGVVGGKSRYIDLWMGYHNTPYNSAKAMFKERRRRRRRRVVLLHCVPGIKAKRRKMFFFSYFQKITDKDWRKIKGVHQKRLLLVGFSYIYIGKGGFILLYNLNRLEDIFSFN